MMQDVLSERIKKTVNRRWIKKLIVSAAITAAAVYLIFGVFFGIGLIRGESMNPAYREGDLIFFQRLGAVYETGDVVLFRSDDDTDDRDNIKRIIAVPGETVEITDGTVYVNGNRLDEPYIYEETSEKEAEYPLTLGEGEYFVLGDHRSDSKDSRNFGAVKEEKLLGKVMGVFRRN